MVKLNKGMAFEQQNQIPEGLYFDAKSKDFIVVHYYPTIESPPRQIRISSSILSLDEFKALRKGDTYNLKEAIDELASAKSLLLRLCSEK